eukprot:GHVN01007142.1.p2 GENE.GHVN01007142.1~~GHVN01007142.1.p2  ORF type:complete len:106 (-),score=7.65 GHVN01007142.1:1249-1566(-)
MNAFRALKDTVGNALGINHSRRTHVVRPRPKTCMDESMKSDGDGDLPDDPNVVGVKAIQTLLKSESRRNFLEMMSTYKQEVNNSLKKVDDRPTELEKSHLLITHG